MESPEQQEAREQDELRNHLNAILVTLRERQGRFAQSGKGRATSIAVTDVEKVSMVVIRCF